MTAFFCHKCRNRCRGLERIDGEVRCNRCHEGFIEEIDEEHGTDGGAGQPAPARVVLEAGADPFGGFPGSPFNHVFNFLRRRGHPPQAAEQGASSNANPNTSSDNGGTDQQPPHNHEEQQQQPADPMAQFVNQLLGQLMAHTQMDNSGGGRLVIQFGIPSRGQGMHGNLQDYAWGEHGLDDVLTALLNQFDQAQEQQRALSPEDIAKLPITQVTQKHVDNMAQCTTCMETFKLDEQVGKLNCDHIFHPDCIKPWLSRNNTCPICRKVIDPKKWGPTITDMEELD